MRQQRRRDDTGPRRRTAFSRRLGIALALLAFAAFPFSIALPASADAPLCDVVIESGHAAQPFHLEIADTPARRAEGLQGRTHLADDGGMLFDFGRPQPVAMWMKNTPISLDMIFVAADGTVASVAERTTPYSLAIIPSPGPVRAVIEVGAGTAQRIGLKPGAHIIAPCLGTGSAPAR